MDLVLLHPLPLDASIWPTELWDLADNVVAPTLYSAGDSLGAWAAAVLDLVGAGDYLVVGNSVGGSCALELAHLDRGRVRGLVLIGAKAGTRPEPSYRDEAIRLLREEGIDAAWGRYWAPLFAPRADPSVVAQAHAIAVGIHIEHHVNGVRAFHNRPDRAALRCRARHPSNDRAREPRPDPEGRSGARARPSAWPIHRSDGRRPLRPRRDALGFRSTVRSALAALR